MERAGAPGAAGDAAGSRAAGAAPQAEQTPPTTHDLGPARDRDAIRSGSRGTSWAVGALLVGVALGWFHLTLDRTFNLRDEGYLLHMSARVAAGEAPHRDFTEAYGPGVFSTTALALDAGRFQIRAVRIWLAVVKTAGVLAVFAILVQVVPRGVALLGALFAVVLMGRASLNLNAPHAALYTVPWGLLATLLLLRANARATPGRHLAAGAAAGLGLLFKQSLAAMLAYGLGLAILAVAWLGPAPGRNRTAGGAPKWLFVVPWCTAAGLLLVPMAPFMTLRDYAIHLLPIHGLMGVVAFAALRTRRPLDPRVAGMERLAPFVLGMVAVLVPVVLLYASWGALSDLVHGMFVFPRSLRNYYLPVTLPRPAFALFGSGIVLAVAAGLAVVAQRRRAAIVRGCVSALGLVAAAILWTAQGGVEALPDRLWRTPALFDWILPTALVVAGSVAILHDARRGRTGAEAAGLIVLTFFQAFLCFQIFPRAGHNVWIAQGAMVPLATLLAYRVFAASTAGRAGGARWAGAILCLALPIWVAAPVVADVLAPRLDGSSVQAVGLPHTRGLSLRGADLQRMRIADVRALVRHLRRTGEPGAPLLVVGNQQMIYFVSDRAHLVPEREFLLYSAASGMIPSSEVHRLGDDEIATRLIDSPDVRVVIPDDPSAERLLALLPSVERTIAGRFEIEARFGPYVVWRPRDRTAAPERG